MSTRPLIIYKAVKKRAQIPFQGHISVIEGLSNLGEGFECLKGGKPRFDVVCAI